MKIAKLALILSLFAPFGLIAMQQEQQPSIKLLPVELQNFIVRNLIDTTFEKSINNIASYAQVDKEFNQIMNDPDNMIWLVNALAKKFPEYDEVFIANGLGNMPGIQSAKFQVWLNALKARKALGRELVKAADANNLKKVQELLAQGASINARDENGNTPLLVLLNTIGMQVNDDTHKILRALLEAGADVNVQMAGSGWTPIIMATMYQRPEIMREILKYSPDLTLTDGFGQTAIHFAAATPDPQFREILREHIQSHGIILPPELMQMLQGPE